MTGLRRRRRSVPQPSSSAPRRLRQPHVRRVPGDYPRARAGVPGHHDVRLLLVGLLALVGRALRPGHADGHQRARGRRTEVDGRPLLDPRLCPQFNLPRFNRRAGARAPRLVAPEARPDRRKRPHDYPRVDGQDALPPRRARRDDYRLSEGRRHDRRPGRDRHARDAHGGACITERERLSFSLSLSHTFSLCFNFFFSCCASHSVCVSVCVLFRLRARRCPSPSPTGARSGKR